MTRYLPYLLIFALWFYAFVDCVGTPEREVRGLAKPVWLTIVMLFGWIPVVPLGWLIAGRGHRRAAPGGAAASAQWRRDRLDEAEQAPPQGSRAGRAERAGRAGRPPLPSQTWTAPDDNPEFLRSLGELNKRNRDRRDGPPPAGEE